MNVSNLMLPWCLWLMAGLCCTSACAQCAVFRSSSGQFTARLLQRPGPLPARSKQPAKLTPVAGSWAYMLTSSPASKMGDAAELTLDPALLIPECERVKKMLLGELGLSDNWQGRIDLIISPSLTEEQGPQLTAIRGSPGWNYELALPRNISDEILLRKLFQTLFLEMANRNAGVQSAEIPLWLVEGMIAHLQSISLQDLMLQPGQSVSDSIVWKKGAEMVPEELRQHPALAFQELSWPRESDLTKEGLPLYRSCARLFLEGLLRLENGKGCLRDMIDQLPEHWNWQTAFLQAFHSHFDQLLDVEKWWGVTYVDFARGYEAQTWFRRRLPPGVAKQPGCSG